MTCPICMLTIADGNHHAGCEDVRARIEAEVVTETVAAIVAYLRRTAEDPTVTASPEYANGVIESADAIEDVEGKP